MIKKIIVYTVYVATGSHLVAKAEPEKGVVLHELIFTKNI